MGICITEDTIEDEDRDKGNGEDNAEGVGVRWGTQRL